MTNLLKADLEAEPSEHINIPFGSMGQRPEYFIFLPHQGIFFNPAFVDDFCFPPAGFKKKPQYMGANDTVKVSDHGELILLSKEIENPEDAKRAKIKHLEDMMLPLQDLKYRS